MLRKGRDAARLAWDYVRATRASRRSAPLFEEVETYCTFIGYSRSGHSVVAALLNAHPEVVMAHEVGALKYLYVGFGRQRLYWLLLQSARRGHSIGRGGGYTYEVPTQWQGRFRRIRVIGDKHGEDTTCRLEADPWLLGRLRGTVGVPVRFIHVYRNPFDNISTMARRQAHGGATPDLEAATDRYFRLCAANAQIKERLGAEEVVDVRHEAFVEEPEAHLNRLCRGLGLTPSATYLEDCACIVRDAPSKSRHKVTWTPVLRRRIEHRMEAFAFLSSYAFDS